ncbi:MAG: SemiSWEET transporter [Pseudomonadota bacterium]|nr:SemiSWEET transporter [Pseudomonadota bacterium]
MPTETLVEIIAFFAGMCTTTSFLPQALKTWKDRDTRAISLGMYIIFCSGIALWFTVGFLLKSPSMMFWNGVSFSLAMSILCMKIFYSRREIREKGTWGGTKQIP